MKYYKAVRVELVKGKEYYFSVFAPGKNKLEYKINEETLPNFGGIFVFERKNEAIDFLNNWGILTFKGFKPVSYYRILSGIGNKYSEELSYCCGDSRMFESFWTTFSKKDSIPLPFGTVILKNFTPDYICKERYW